MIKSKKTFDDQVEACQYFDQFLFTEHTYKGFVKRYKLLIQNLKEFLIYNRSLTEYDLRRIYATLSGKHSFSYGDDEKDFHIAIDEDSIFIRELNSTYKFIENDAFIIMGVTNHPLQRLKRQIQVLTEGEKKLVDQIVIGNKEDHLFVGEKWRVI